MACLDWPFINFRGSSMYFAGERDFTAVAECDDQLTLQLAFYREYVLDLGLHSHT
jgi:hypothetical protein